MNQKYALESEFSPAQTDVRSKLSNAVKKINFSAVGKCNCEMAAVIVFLQLSETESYCPNLSIIMQHKQNEVFAQILTTDEQHAWSIGVI